MATSTVEDYLKCILQQAGDDQLVGMGAIASALDVAPGTVTAMMKTLSDSGLVHYEPYSGVRLTEPGRKLAVHVLRRHRLLEQFLVQIVGLDWAYVHEEAEHLEHAVSERLIERIDEMLGYPSVDPHGDPIPDARGRVENVDLPNLVDCDIGVPHTVVRVSEQSAAFLGLLDSGGLRPGVLVEVAKRDSERVDLRVRDGEPFVLAADAARQVLVRAC